MKKIILMLGLVLSVTSCGLTPDRNFYIDNPTDNPINVTLDGTVYQIPPDHSEKVKLEIGYHDLVLPDGQSVKFNVYDQNKGGIINPTRSLYVLYTIVYATDENPQGVTTSYNELFIDSVLYEGPISTVSDLFIDKCRYYYMYGPRESFPDEITVSENIGGGHRNKLFTKKEYIDFYETETDSKGFHDQNKMDGVINNPTRNYTTEIPAANFKIPELQLVAEELLELLKKYVASTDADKQKEMLKEYNVKIMEMYTKSEPLNAFENHTSEERLEYADFMRDCGYIFSNGIAEVK